MSTDERKGAWWEFHPDYAKPAEANAEESATQIEQEAGGEGAAEDKASAPTLADIEHALSELRSLRRTDERAYLRPENQSRELSLIEQREALRAGKPAPVAEAKAATVETEAAKPEVDAIDAELAELRKMRGENPRAFTNEMAARELELLTAKEVGGDGGPRSDAS